MPNWFSYLSDCVDVGENLVMAYDVVTPSNLLITPIDEKKLEEAPLDLIISQRLHEEKSLRILVRTRVDRWAWDRRSSPNPHALAIYLEFVPAHGAVPERFEKCQCEDDDVHFHLSNLGSR
jgi:hypothetical protein